MISTTIAGRIGKDAVVREAGSTTVCSFPVAVDVGYGDKKNTHWFDCSLWGKRGETLCQYLTKGSQVTVTGEQDEREYNDKVYKTLRVNDVALQGGGKSESRQQQAPKQQAYQDSLEDDIPF